MPEGTLPGTSDSVGRVLRTGLGTLLLRPWFDRAALRLLVGWYFPLSRAWASALAAGGTPERFFAQCPDGRRTDRLIGRVLALVERRQRGLAAADARWEHAFFGKGPGTAEIEAARLRAAARLMGLRTAFAPMHLERPYAPIAWEIEDPASVRVRHGARLAHPETAFAVSADCAAVEASRGFFFGDRVDGWVRFPAPVAAVGSTAWARVSLPAAAADPSSRAPLPSVIFAHGIGMEPEFWGMARDPLNGLVGVGMRVIRPEAPWHGRRRLAGRFGGEPILARGTGGLLDFFQAAVAEIGRMIAWARATRGGPVAIGGVSLGALTAQLVAVVARDWPQAMRPDALLLVAPSRSMTRVVFEGSLSVALGEPHALKAAGWGDGDIAQWLPLLEPQGEPVVPPERIIVVLGEADDVTLAEGGEALVRDWRVPEANVFRCTAGHFSTSLGLSRDGAPIGRLVSVLRRAA